MGSAPFRSDSHRYRGGFRRYHDGNSPVDVPGRGGDIRLMGIAVLGSLEVDGRASTLGLRDRVVLQALAVRPGVVVGRDSLAEAIWGENPPASWAKIIQGCIVRLRKVLGGDAIETTPHGYRLHIHVDHVDHLRFEQLIGRARELLALGEQERATYLLGEALGLWRGEPFIEISDWAPGRIELERLVELRRDAEDLRTEALLRCGRFHEVLGPAVRLVQEAPFRERRWGLLALAQYQDGRQRDALETLHRARSVVVNELGLDPGPDLISLEQAILHQDPSLAVTAALPETSQACPYLGLLAYDISDAAAYFGREADIASCLDRIDAAGALAIVGPSGSGKSSLARAGVAAALERDGRRVRVITPGSRPMDALAGMPRGAGSVLLVDQCEEALAMGDSSTERVGFFAALADFAGSGKLIVTLRADRLGEVSVYPAFAHLVERGLYLLGPMNQVELRRAIEGPAEQAGLRLEPGLVDLLVREIEGAPGALPLLSHVLRQTWTRREGATLTVAGYRATGGVREAVSQSAESLFRDLTQSQQSMLRDLMLRLVIPDASGDPVRTRAPRRSLPTDDEHEMLIERLVRARLVSSDGDTVEIAHESLAVAWPRLQSWLDDDVEGLRVMRHLSVSAASWDELGRPDSELYRGVRQSSAEQWRNTRDPVLTPAEREFLDASAALAETTARATEQQVRRERRTNRRLRAGLAAVAAVSVVALVAGFLAVTAADRAERQSVSADARLLGSEALRNTDIDRALLLAVAATKLDDTPDTRSNLTSVLDRAPQLIDTARRGTMLSIAMEPDGRALATGGPMSGVSIVDPATLTEVARNFDVPVRRVQFSPDGSQLVVAVNPWKPTGDRRIDPIPLRLLDPDTAALSKVQLGGVPRGRVLHNSFLFSTNGRWLAAAFIHPNQTDTDSWIRVWDTRDYTRPVAAFTLPYIAVNIAVNNDGTRAYVAAEDNRVHAVDLARQRETGSAPISINGYGGDVALTPDGKSVAATLDKTITLLDPERLSVQRVIKEDGVIGGDLAISATGDKIGYAVDDVLVVRALSDPDAAGVRYPLGDKIAPSGIAFSPDERTVYATRVDGLLLAWDTVGDRQFVPRRPQSPQPDPAEVGYARVSPDGRTVAYFVTDGKESWAVQFLDLRSGAWTSRSPLVHTPTYFTDVAWRPDSTELAVVQGDYTVRRFDRSTGGPTAEPAEPAVPAEHGVLCAVGFSGDGSRLLVGTDDGWVHTINTVSGRPAGRPILVMATFPVLTIGVNHDGSRALTSAGGKVQLLDVSAGTVLRTADIGFQAQAFAWSRDMATVAVSGIDSSTDGSGRVALLDPATLKTRSPSAGPQTAGGWFVAYSRDGGRFVTASAGRVSLWESATAHLLGSMSVEGADGAGFDADTNNVLIASTVPKVSAWDPRPQAAVEAACRLAGRDLTMQEWETYLPNRPYSSVCQY